LCFILALNPWFNVAIFMVVLFNCAALLFDRYKIDPESAKVIEIVNISATFVYLLEFAIKLLGLGPSLFVKDLLNIVDTVVLGLGLVDFSLYSSSFD